MPDVPYARSRSALYHPGKATDFFSLGGPPTDAALCVEMARVAYVKADAPLRSALARAGFELRRPLDRSGSQGFIAENETTVVVAFRGSEPEDPTDLFSDGEFPFTPWSAGGKVHHGFADAFRLLWDEVSSDLPPGKRLLFTGHSLGAALATLASTLQRPAGLYTFGSPRVGDADFVRAADQVDHSRYVDCCDAVCLVPPESFGYRHCGRRAFIDRTGTVRPGVSEQDIDAERGAASREYLLKFGFLLLNVVARELADHAPLNYSSAVLGVRSAS
jgi:hypothetical protein